MVGSQTRKRIKPVRTIPLPIPRKRREAVRLAMKASAPPKINKM
jgi:hypothetical protein